MLAKNKIGQGFAMPFAAAAPWIALFLLMLAGGSAILAAKKRKLVDGQTSLESVRSLSWKEFEWMVAEAYRRMGYAVDHSVGGGADGGIDVVLRKGAETVIVQCKQWKVFSVGAPIIREIFGLLAHHQASRAIVITSGKFTADAQAFASGKPIELVDGPALLRLVQGVQSRGTQTTPPAVSTSSTQGCPKCGSEMVMRTAKRGARAGNSFWGCSAYPTCTGTRDFVG
jgi:restriction system protein